MAKSLVVRTVVIGLPENTTCAIEDGVESTRVLHPKIVEDDSHSKQ